MKSGEKPYESAEPCLFISYSHRDSAHVLPVLDAMRKCGYRICYDGMIPAGESWTKFLAEHISDCAVFLPFLSAAFLASEQCLKEVRFMDSKERLVVPVWLEKPDRNGVPPEVEFLLNKSQELRLDDFPDVDAFAAHLQREPNFQSCRDTVADTVAASAELVTNERPVDVLPSFVGRVKIMDDIETAFRNGENIVNLYGMGGIGKSEICRKLFHDRAHVLSKYTGWLTWRDTLQNTLYAQFRDIEENNAERYLRLAREFIRKKGRDLLIFLDNADDMDDTQAAELTRLECRFLVTSRHIQERFRAFPAGTLTPEECRILYRRALFRNETLSDGSPDDVLDKILHLAAYHTLTVELLAKTQRASGLDTRELLDKLTESGFDLTGVEEEITYEHRPEQGGKGEGKRTFLEHMKVVFDLSNLRADALRVLQGMSLLAPNTPISVKTVKQWLGLSNLNGLNRAADAGWLDEHLESNGARTVSIHPVIAAVVRDTAPPDAELVDTVAGHLADDMIPNATEIFTVKLPFLKHALTLNRVAESMNLQTENCASMLHQTENYASMLHQMGYLTDEQGDYTSALEWYQKTLRIFETVLGKEHPDTATTYNNIAGVYYAQGDYPKALEGYQQALRIFETVLGKEHPSTATTYNNIGQVYYAQGDYPKALEWYQKALHIKETVLGKDHPDTAATYNNIAIVYHKQGDYPKALEWYQKALRIFETVLGTEHPDTAITYNNIGQVYYAQGDYPKALEWYQKDLRISETVLGTEHPSTATTYNNIALVYHAQEDYPKALEWYQKALRILETVLGTENPDTAKTYNNIAGVYHAQEDYPKALEWYQKALAVFMKVLGAEHPYTKIVRGHIDDVRKHMT